MALLGFEGFDGLASGTIPGWNGGGGTINSGNGRTGNGIELNANGVMTATCAATDVYLGFASKCFEAGKPIAVFRGASGANHVWLRLVNPNTFELKQGNDDGTGPSLTTTARVVTSGWLYVEMRVVFGASGTGRITVRQNGVQTLDWTGTTKYAGDGGSADTQFTQIGPFGWYSNCFDDVYAADASGGQTFFGDCKVVTLFPNGNGASSQGTGSDSDSTNNYLLVDDATPDTADYVDLSSGEKDTYAYTNHGLGSGTVVGVQVRSYVSKTDAGAVNLRNVARLSGVESYGASFAPSSGSYGFTNTVMTVKPGGGAWTRADVDAAEFGAEGLP